jgi:hypothetical protein
VSRERDRSRKLKVVDRRRFTDAGDLRDDRPTAPAPKPQPTPPRPKPTAPRGPATSQAFLDLVATLAQQAELLIAGGQGLPRQPDQARLLIDYLAVLESKTRGNLSAEEQQVLSNVVFQLRSLYVSQTT